jgi:hypothetical protein
MLLGILHCIPDHDNPYAIVARLMDAVPPGSYLTISHPASDITTGQITTAIRRYNDLAAEPATLRTHAQVSRFFDRLELLEPGVVQLHRWRPGTADPDPGHDLANYGALAHKP